MSYFKKELKFPCGMEYKVEINSWNLEVESSITNTICPIHGKDCIVQKPTKGKK